MNEEIANRVAEVLIEHGRDGIEGCRCGWAELGKSHAKHVAQAMSDKRLLRKGFEVTITSGMGKPSTCVVTERGRVVFDGISRDALLRRDEESE